MGDRKWSKVHEQRVFWPQPLWDKMRAAAQTFASATPAPGFVPDPDPADPSRVRYVPDMHTCVIQWVGTFLDLLDTAKAQRDVQTRLVLTPDELAKLVELKEKYNAPR